MLLPWVGSIGSIWASAGLGRTVFAAGVFVAGVFAAGVFAA
ncbi:MAG: hypothetical protein VKJ85_09095 [Prochlorothrix sp.]|nr:hypothetical protein [Prochlorothrix sp.]